jgi:L-amino acid N-acyltransferase YncA
MKQKIYNHYVDHTIFANEFDARTEDQIRDRINVIVTAGLPYLVAVARGNQPRGPAGFVTEKIVGFASLDDYCDQSSMYRYTFEMELYTHPGYQSQNIASCLLDRLLEMANTGYNACGGYEYRNDWEYLKTGPSRVIKTIMLTVCKENGENDDQTAEFMKRFKFYRAGHIPRMGYKLDKVVDVFLYRHTTSETIEPGSRPSVPLER